jgi:hypothetical protein
MLFLRALFIFTVDDDFLWARRFRLQQGNGFDLGIIFIDMIARRTRPRYFHSEVATIPEALSKDRSSGGILPVRFAHKAG